jgi:hypothetical protein
MEGQVFNAHPVRQGHQRWLTQWEFSRNGYGFVSIIFRHAHGKLFAYHSNRILVNVESKAR